ncbi:hypothetical protein U1Q18_012481 [Sarracenia purpurea var. burkii]
MKMATTLVAATQNGGTDDRWLVMAIPEAKDFGGGNVLHGDRWYNMATPYSYACGGGYTGRLESVDRICTYLR